MNEAQMRAEFEAWWANFQSEHEEWKYADGEDLLFQAWLAALSSQSAKSVPNGSFMDLEDSDYVAKRFRLILTKLGISTPESDEELLLGAFSYLGMARRALEDILTAPQPPTDERVRELEKDAARYRYLRDNCSSADEGGLGMIATDLQFTSLINHELVKKWPDALDKSIDQAIEAMKGE